MTSNDLIPGIVAAIAFLAMLFLLGPSLFWIAAALAVALYFGVRFLLSSSGTPLPIPVEKIPTPRERVSALRSQAAQITLPLQEKVETLCHRADALLADADRLPLQTVETVATMTQYLEVVRLALERYQSSSQRGGNTQARQALEQILDSANERFTALHETIRREDDAATASEISALHQTLKEMDEVMLQINAGGRR